MAAFVSAWEGSSALPTGRRLREGDGEQRKDARQAKHLMPEHQ
jgi:hypothetical protein